MCTNSLNNAASMDVCGVCVPELLLVQGQCPASSSVAGLSQNSIIIKCLGIEEWWDMSNVADHVQCKGGPVVSHV